MADQTTDAIGRPGGTLPTLILSTLAKTYEFTYPSGGGGRPINRTIGLVSEADWFVAEPNDANYVPVAATQPYEITLDRGTVTVYCKAESGAPELSCYIVN